MKKMNVIIATLIGVAPLLFAETNALIEVKLFKDWVIKEEEFSLNLNIAIKNTGTAPVLLAKKLVHFSSWQLAMRSLPPKPDNKRDERRGNADRVAFSKDSDYFFELPPEETHIYEERKFLIDEQVPFSEEMRFTISVYFGNGVWLDSEPMTLNGVVPDSEEHVATLTNVNGSRDLVVITYKNERWLYTKLGGYYFAVCPLSLTNKIRVEPHDGKRLHKIWDGDKSMIYELGQSMLTEGPDENNVFGKWTRERKQRAEADNAEVRRKKAEVQAQ